MIFGISISLFTTVLLGAVLYLAVGSVAVILTAYTLSLTGDDEWFSPVRDDRWTHHTAAMSLPPLLIFLLWPMAGVYSLVYAVGRAWAKLTEVAATKLRGHATKRAAQLRGRTG